MSIELSFAPEFYYAEGEPYDRCELALTADGHPTSVWSALCMMATTDKKQWRALARDCFDLQSANDQDRLMVEGAMALLRETRKCTRVSLTSPIEIWIDPKGDYRIKVY